MRSVQAISVLAAMCVVVSGIAGCIDSGPKIGGGKGEMRVLGRASGGEWINGTVSGNFTETITVETREDPAQRTKTAPVFEFIIENASGAVSWDFGDGGTGEGDNATHSYASPGNYFVNASAGGKSANITVAANYAASGEDSVTTIPGQDPGGPAALFQKGTNYQEYIFAVGKGAKKCEINLDGTGMVDEAADIDMRLYDPSGKEIASSTGATVDETITTKALKVPGNYKLVIGQTPGGAYISIGDVTYKFTIAVAYA